VGVSIAGIILSLLLLMLLAYRGVNVIILAPLMAMLAVLLDGGLHLLPAYTQLFMTSLGKFITSYFPLFLLGAVFGKVMEDTGSAAAIAGAISRRFGAHRAILATVLACAVLTYGGVSLFVVVFAVYPLSAALFRAADVPKRLIPGCIALGAFTFTMTALPGTMQIQNMIPMKYFGTTVFAGPITGTIGGVITAVLGLLWLQRRAATARLAGEGYGASHVNEPAEAPRTLPPLWAAVLPIVFVVAINYVLSEQVMRRWDAAAMSHAKLTPFTLNDVRGLWAAICALLVGIAVALPLYRGTGRSLNRSLTDGAIGSLLPIFNTASEVGYGKTIAALGGFAAMKSGLMNLPGSVLVSEFVSVNVLSGITGSASGGLSIALESLGPTYIQRGAEANISPELLHRIAVMSCAGLDTLPHNGAVITLLIICGLTHRQAYKDIFVVSLLAPLAATAAVLLGLAAVGIR
jgi:H+/gluconate symporter-like permease